MKEKETAPLYRRSRKKRANAIETLAKAQEIVFAPFTFQTVATMLDLGIMDYLKGNKASIEEIMTNCSVSKYCAKTVLEVALISGIVSFDDEKFTLSALGETFLDNEMTRVNFNFMKDVCYLGASELKNSFVQAKPVGLQKFIENSPTIYPLLSRLPKEIRKSWYEFDHYYSDTCFEDVLKIMFKNKPEEIFDIGGNTGKFEKACLAFDKDIKVTMLDLPENLEKAKNNVNSKRCNYWGINVIEEGAKFPKMRGAVLMSQFLDCFSEEQIILILSNVAKSAQEGTRIYILEPFIDNQQFKGAAYSLAHISLYFTCMANGTSKMYSEKDMLEFIEKAGLKVENKYTIGIHDYTLLECVKNEVV